MMLHLIHPACVHFTVAFLVLGGVVEAVGLLTERMRAVRAGSWLVLAGTASIVPTLVSGYLAANSLEISGTARQVLDAHERNGLIVLGIFLFGQFWKAWYRGELPGGQRPLYALFLLLAVGLAVYSAVLGGELVYVHGVGVAPRP